MIRKRYPWSLLLWALLANIIQNISTLQIPLMLDDPSRTNHEISADLFIELEELSRIVDIAYCVGLAGAGIQKPFSCASRCHDFEGFELVTTWNTGVFFSDSCGYIVVSHPPSVPRIIIAFRGTYSFANTIVDLTTIPQEYIPYPGDDGDDIDDPGINIEKRRCVNCSVHAGFMTSWRHSRPYIIPYLKELIKKYPDYRLTLVGHSLGGAVAALAALEFEARGWNPQTTTFGEPKIGNLALVKYIDRVFAIRSQQTNTSAVYRRITHINDPVPLLPLREWGYRMHAGEIYISKTELSPLAADIHHCEGDEDPECIAGMGSLVLGLASLSANFDQDVENFEDWWRRTEGLLTIPARFRIWQLFFAHRDYFWRLGLCIPGGDPKNWFRKYDDINSSEL